MFNICRGFSHRISRFLPHLQIELPANQWPDLINTLLNNMNQPNDNIKQSTLMALGYICEEIVKRCTHLSNFFWLVLFPSPTFQEPEVLKTQSNSILTAVCAKGMKDPNPEIKYVACNALNNALGFASSNMEKEGERDYVMTVVCECCSSQEEKVRGAALECLVKVAEEYYHLLDKYMQTIFNVSKNLW